MASSTDMTEAGAVAEAASAPTPRVVGDHLFAGDRASRGLGMTIVAIGAGTATLEMTVEARMLNGFDICHGGFITTLADSAFAFACNSRNDVTVAAGLSVDFLAPAHEGDVLTAVASEVSRRGRTGVYDMIVSNQRGERVALVRGRSAQLKGRTVLPVGASGAVAAKGAA